MRTFAQKTKSNQQTTSANFFTRPSHAHSEQNHEANSIPHLQRTIGNQAVQRLLEENQTTRFGHDFSRLPVHAPPTGAIQTKPAINKPGDEYEQEADRVAEQVMRMPEPAVQRTPAGQVENNLTPSVSSSLALKMLSMRGDGQPLPVSTRAFFEPRFSCDLSGVRLHTNDQASASAKALKAKAFTMGDDIAFGADYYSASTQSGKLLLAHELTHVLQNRRRINQGIMKIRRAPDEKKSHASKEPASKPKTTPAATPAKSQEQQKESKPSSKWRWKDLAVYPLLVDIWHDVITKKGLTKEERKKLSLKGYEAAAFYPWAFAVGLPFLGLGEGYEEGFSEGLDVYYKYVEGLGELTPSKDVIFDSLSRIAGIRLDDYFASDTFKSRLKLHAASLPTLALATYGIYYGIQAGKAATAEEGEFEPAEWSKHIGVPWLAGKLFKEYLKAPDFFSVGPLELKSHPAFAYKSFLGAAPPEGLTLEGSKGKGAGEGGKETKLALTLNLPKLISLAGEGELSAEDFGNLEKYRGWQTSLWFSMEDYDPTATMAAAGKIPEFKLKAGTIFGAKGHLGLLEAGGTTLGSDAEKLTTWFIKGGYGYSWKNHKFLKKLGFTASYIDYQDFDIPAPGSAPGAPVSGKAFQITPFAKFEFGKRHKFGAGTALSFISGTGDPFNVSKFRVDLSYTYLGDRSPDKLPVFKLDLSGSLHRLDWWHPDSPLMWGVQAKGTYEKYFGGVQVMGGAGEIPESRALRIGEPVKVRVPTGVLFIGGYSF